MNDSRRRQIKKAASNWMEKHAELMQELNEELQAILDAEQEAYDNLPENIQETEKGEAMQECIDMMQEVVDACDETGDFEDGLIEMCKTCGVDL